MTTERCRLNSIVIQFFYTHSKKIPSTKSAEGLLSDVSAHFLLRRFDVNVLPVVLRYLHTYNRSHRNICLVWQSILSPKRDHCVQPTAIHSRNLPDRSPVIACTVDKLLASSADLCGQFSQRINILLVQRGHLPYILHSTLYYPPLTHRRHKCTVRTPL